MISSYKPMMDFYVYYMYGKHTLLISVDCNTFDRIIREFAKEFTIRKQEVIMDHDCMMEYSFTNYWGDPQIIGYSILRNKLKEV